MDPLLQSNLRATVIARLMLASVCVLSLLQGALTLHTAQAASAPNIITYQGRLLNSNGIPLASSSASLVFEFYTASSGGSCVWSNSSSTCASATARTVTLTDGLFSENLGDTTAGTPYAAIGDSIFANNAALYLQVTVGGEALTPRKQIVAAPYALNSDTLDGLDADNDGATADAIVAYNSSGNLVVTGNPSGAGVSAGALYVNPASSDTSANDTIFGVADGGSVAFRVDKEGDVVATGDLALNGGDLTSSSGTFNFLDAAGDSTSIDIGGVTTSLANTINIATNSTAADTIAVGNSNAATTLALTGGDDWSISSGGLGTFSSFTSSGLATLNGNVDLNFTTDGAQSENMAFTITHATDVSMTPLTMLFTDTAPADTGANYFIALHNFNDGGATGTPDGFITLESSDTNETVATGINFGIDPGAVLTTAFDATDAEIGTALSVAANSITGTTGVISYTNWSISAAGAPSFDGVANFNDDVNFNFNTDGAASENFVITSTHGTDVALNPAVINFTDTAAADTASNNLLLVQNADDGGATGTPDTLALFTNSDTNELVADGLLISAAAGGLTDGIDVSDADLTNAINIGANFLQFDGQIRMAELSAGVLTWEDTSGNDLATLTDGGTTGTLSVTGPITTISIDHTTAGTLAIGDNNTNTVSMCNGTSCDTVLIATNTDADLINIGDSLDDVSIIDDNWSIQTNGTAVLSDLAVNGGDLTSTSSTFNFLDAASNSTTLEIGGVTTDLGNTIAVATNSTTADTLTFGNSNGSTTVAITGGDDWSIAATGVLTLSASAAATTAIVATDTDYTNGISLGDNFVLFSAIRQAELSAGVLTWEDTSGNDLATLTDNGTSGTLLVSDADVFGGDLRVSSNIAGRVATFINDGNDDTHDGIEIQACLDSNPTATCDFAKFFDGDGTVVGAIEGTGAGGVSFNAAGGDYAELFPGNYASLSPGDVLGLDTSGQVVRASDTTTPLGAYSVAPSTLGNWFQNWQSTGTHVAVALLGQVPINVNTSGGSIQVGDHLALSSTPGVATKLNGPGTVIGVALEPVVTGSAQIMAYVHVGWYAGNVMDSDGSVTLFTDDVAMSAIARATAATPTQNSQAFLFRGSAWDGSAAQTVSMGLVNKVTSPSASRLAFTNNTGTEVASVNQSGDLILSGKLYPSGSGVAQTSSYIYYDAAGVGYMRTNAAGWGTGSYDFAEMFPSPEPLVPGEVVIFGDAKEQMKRSPGTPYNDKVAGVVSTRPGFLAGNYRPGDYPVALTGRVPTFVTNENGPVATGDPLTTSSRAGYAMKATEPGPIVGYAMEEMTSSEGSIIVFVRPSYYDGSGPNQAPEAQNELSGISNNVTNLNVSGSLAMNGGSILGLSSIVSGNGLWRIDEQGNLQTEGRLIQIVNSYQNEKVETYAATSREMTIQLSGTAVLHGGMASVQFDAVDPKFNDIISSTAPYRAFVTPSGITGQLYVSDRSNAGFTIQAQDSTDGVLVDWLVIAYRKDYEPAVAAEPVETLPPDNIAGQTAEAPVEPAPADSSPLTPSINGGGAEPSSEPEPIVAGESDESVTEPVIETPPEETPSPSDIPSSPADSDAAPDVAL